MSGISDTSTLTPKSRPPRDQDTPGDTVNAGPEKLKDPCPEPSKFTKPGFIGAIEQRVGFSRFILYDIATAEPVASHTVEVPSSHPQPGWHEIDPDAIVDSVDICIQQAFADFVSQGFEKEDIKAVGIANQRGTTVVWDFSTGDPLYPAVAADDTRTVDEVASGRILLMANIIPSLTGIPISDACSSIKLGWLINNVEAVDRAWSDGRLAFGTIDTWLIYNLNGATLAPDGPVHVTDSTNASRTLLMNLRNLHYEPGILDLFGLDPDDILFPTIVASSDPHAFGAIVHGPLKGIRITGCLGDENAILVGQCALLPGEAKVTYRDDGSASILFSVGKEKPMIRDWFQGLQATVAYDFETTGVFRFADFALEASAPAVAPAMGPLVRSLGLATDEPVIKTMVREAERSTEDSRMVTLVAASDVYDLAGAGQVTGYILGLTPETTKGQIAHAAVESTCYQTQDFLQKMTEISGHKIHYLAADGDLTNSDFCMQTQADTLWSDVHCRAGAADDTAALGAAFAAGIGIGVWNLDDLRKLRATREARGRHFTPNMELDRQQPLSRKMCRWRQAARMSRDWLLMYPENEGTGSTDITDSTGGWLTTSPSSSEKEGDDVVLRAGGDNAEGKEEEKDGAEEDEMKEKETEDK